MKLPIYLDYNATTPLDPRVLEAMMPFFIDKFGNPHSSSHSYGWEAEAAIDIAREQVKDMINAETVENIIFTSGATESNNTATKAVAHYYYPKFNHIITSNYEHKCVTNSLKRLEQKGFKVTYLPVESNGILNPDKIVSAIMDKTFLVSVMAVNNEIGTINNIEKIGNICRDNNILFHTDAAQAIGKIPIDVQKMNIDLLSISGHKIYGPKGIGALYINRNRVKLFPLFTGGNQEFGLRAGTVPTPLVVGLGKALEIAKKEMKKDHDHCIMLRNIIIDKLSKSAINIKINGDIDNRVTGNLNFHVPNIKGVGKLFSNLHDVAISSGSACNQGGFEASDVLLNIGLNLVEASSSIRMGFGRFTTVEEINYATESIIKNINITQSN